MSEAISDLVNQTQLEDLERFYEPSDIPAQPAIDCNRKYAGKTHASKLRHFARIPGRIVRCLDYFQIEGDRKSAARILGAYYFFIGVIDDALDSGEAQTATIVFENLSTPSEHPSSNSDVALAASTLGSYLSKETRTAVIEGLHELYARVLDEQSARSIENYIERRKAVGRLTADLSYLVIRPVLAGEESSLRVFMQRVGGTGCLVDSIIDWRADRRQGVFRFEPTITDYFKLVRATCSDGLNILRDHPRLTGVFAQAILDNVCDRFVIPATNRYAGGKDCEAAVGR